MKLIPLKIFLSLNRAGLQNEYRGELNINVFVKRGKITDYFKSNI